MTFLFNSDPVCLKSICIKYCIFIRKNKKHLAGQSSLLVQEAKSVYSQKREKGEIEIGVP